MDIDRSMAERIWLAVTGGITALLAIGAAVFPDTVYDRFLWQYFWGPVEADGRNEACVARENGQTVVPDNCATATGIVAEPGYTIVSTVSYGLVLVLLLVGIYLFAKRFEILTSLSVIYALFPFVLLGGTLRTVEDASVGLMEVTGDPAIAFPYSAILISPFIYFFVFLLAVIALVGSLYLVRRGTVDRYEYPLAAAGTFLLVGSLGYLGYLVVTTDVLGFNPWVPIITLGGATILTWVVWVVTERYIPTVNAGTGLVGALIVWGHTVDGVANVLSLDWYDTLDIPQYEPKHVVNAAVRDITSAAQPAWLSDMIGITWPFLPLKIFAAVVVVYLFNDELYREMPRYTVLLLIAVLAVGLGPGTRDFLRATFGI